MSNSGSNGKRILSLPSGDVSTDEIGAEYVVGQSGQVPVAELVDPKSADQVARERETFIRNSPLVRAVENQAPKAELLHEVIKEISEELAHMKYERKKAITEGKPTLNHNMARVASLRALSDLLLKAKQIALTEQLDLKSPRLQKIFRLWMEMFHESMEKVGIEPSSIDLVFQQMKSDMIDWEKKMSDNSD